MVETSQNDVDSLMDSMNESSVEPENDNNSETEKSQSSEDTVDSANIQEEAKTDAEKDSEPEKNDPRGRPWVDFVPEFQHVKPETMVGVLKEEIKNRNEMMKDKEDLKLWSLEGNIHRSYYDLWGFASNRLFRNIVRLKDRLEAKENNKPLKEF